MASTPFIVGNGQGSSGTCLDAELLASYIDGRATPAERAAVEAHLARCEECYFVFSETFQEQKSEAGAPAVADVIPSPGPKPRPGAIAWRMTAGLATAAAVVLAVQLYRTSTEQADRHLVIALHELEQASGPYRPVAGRLSGGTAYRPVAAPVRSGTSTGGAPLEVRDAALNVELAAQGGSPLERRALTIAYLARHEPQRAADVAATLAQSTSEPALLNDAAVALLATGRADDATRARALLEQVIARDPTRAEAYFNLGLAAEASGDAAGARVAWSRYLVIDPSSPWAAEAREHLEKVVGVSRVPQ
jgi:tetratricopeptide (TPR) repeat protein